MTTPEQFGTEGLSSWSVLSHAVQSSELTVKVDALSQAVQVCGRFIDSMRKLQQEFDQEKVVNGFGNLPSGRAVARHFTDKQREMVDVLDQYIDVATKIKAVFTDAAQRYSVTHEDHVAALRTLDAGR